MFDAEGAAVEAMEAFGRYVVCLQDLRIAKGTVPRIKLHAQYSEWAAFLLISFQSDDFCSGTFLF